MAWRGMLVPFIRQPARTGQLARRARTESAMAGAVAGAAPAEQSKAALDPIGTEAVFGRAGLLSPARPSQVA